MRENVTQAADDSFREPAGVELVDDVSPVWSPELPLV